MTVYATTPPSSRFRPEEYFEHVTQVARWSEAAGCFGTLVYTDNSLVDPWLVAQAILQATERLSPLVAIQPIYMHPYTAARMVSTLAFWHSRPVALNMLAGGFKHDLEALGDETPHDDRYVRTAEYTRIMTALLAGETVTLEGAYYTVRNLRLTPALAPELRPPVLISGSSSAGLEAARSLGATAVRYPRAPGVEDDALADSSIPYGVRVGIIGRETDEEAWRIALERFPEDRKGQIAHAMAMKVSDSRWHKQLSEMAGDADGPYWLRPFQNYNTFCPYLVGSHARVAGEIAAYLAQGFTTFVLDVPASEEELHHTGLVLNAALAAHRGGTTDGG